MGNLLSGIKFFELFSGKKEYRLLMLGLDAAGKTTILYKLKLKETVHTIPTIGFNVETVQYKNIQWVMWDIGGQEKIRPLWRHYYTGVDGLIFVVDCNDKERIEEARDELKALMNERELQNASVLVLANKQDLPNALKTYEVTQSLGLKEHKGNHWFVQPCVATTGEGLYEGLEWLSKQFKQKK